MASLLVIGGSGFFGKSILDAFRRGLLHSWDITDIKILSRSATELRVKNPELISSNVNLINADISICTELPFADFVIHAASTTDAARYLLQPEAEHKNITNSTLNYCKLAQKFHLKSKILYISSGAVYGNQMSEVMSISEECSTESSLVGMPINKIGYAAAKRESEKMILNLRSSEMDVSIARCFAFVGRYLPFDQHFAVGNFIQDGILGRPIQVKAEHQVYRSYMHADDLVRWLMAIANYEGNELPIFNVGSDESISIQDLGIMVANIFHVNVSLTKIKNNYVDRYVPSINKAQNLLNLKLEYDLKKSLIDVASKFTKK